MRKGTYAGMERVIDASSDSDQELGESHESDHEELDYQDFEEDTYSAAIVFLVRDLEKIAKSTTKTPGMRIGRTSLTILLLFINIGIQIFLLCNVKWFVTAKAVHDMRNGYSDFESMMYDGAVTLTVNGKARGIDGHFNATNFALLTEDQKSEACRIPFSQPAFFKVILLIWSLTVAAEFRTLIDLWWRTIWRTNVVTSMKFALKPIEETETPHDFVIVAMTRPVKAFILLFMLIPRLLITSTLLYLGCRWLCATTNFGDLILNAVALEFILALSGLLYKAVLPERNKREVRYTKMDVRDEAVNNMTLGDAILPFGWFVVCAFWVFLYFNYVQSVLPGYKFDVHDVCVQWIKERYSV